MVNRESHTSREVQVKRGLYLLQGLAVLAVLATGLTYCLATALGSLLPTSRTSWLVL